MGCASHASSRRPKTIAPSDTGHAADIDDLVTTGPRQVDVTAQVQDDVDNSRPLSQYRLRGAIGTNNDGVADWVIFSDADNTTDPAQRPFLFIEFTMP